MGAVLGALRQGHNGGVWSVCAHDGALYTGSGDSTAKRWDLSTGACTHTFEGHTGDVRSVCAHDGGDRGLHLYTGADDKTAKRWDIESALPELTYTKLSPIVVASRLNKSLFFGLQSISFPFQDKFPWASPVRVVVIALPIFRLDYQLPRLSFGAVLALLVALALLFAICAYTDAYGRARARQQTEESKVDALSRDCDDSVHETEWKSTCGREKYDICACGKMQLKNPKVRKIRRKQKLYGVAATVAAVFSKVISVFVLVYIVRVLFSVVDCTKQSACFPASPGPLATTTATDSGSGSWGAAPQAAHCYHVFRNGSHGARFSVGAAVANGSRTWDLYPEVPCYEGDHLVYTILAIPTLLAFLPVALRLGAVDGDPARLQKRRVESGSGHYSVCGLMLHGWWEESDGDYAGPLSEATTGKKFALISTLARITLSLADVLLTNHHQVS